MNNYIYKIADVSIACQLPFELTIHRESEEFLHVLDERADFSIVEENADFSVCLTRVEELPPLPEGGQWHKNRYYVHRNGRLDVFYDIGDGRIFIHTMREDGGRKLYGEYLSCWERELIYSKNLFDIIGIETILLQHHAFILHSSFISHEGDGILFTAPSGTGKSTQAELWEQHRGAEVVNGDRAGVRLVGSQWRAYGLPYAGSSGVYKQMNAPIRAIVALEQAPVNEVRRLSVMEAFQRIFPEINMYRWDSYYTGIIFEFLMELLREIPVFLLRCTPEVEAVCALERALECNEF